MFDYNNFPYATRRTPVFAHKGMVATAQPLAAQAGLEILKKGGNHAQTIRLPHGGPMR